MWEKLSVQGAIDFDLPSHWLKTWHEPITKRRNCDCVITSTLILKTALILEVIVKGILQMQVLVSLITHVPTFTRIAVFIIFWQDLEGVEELIREHQDNLVAIGEVCESLMLKPERHTLIRKEQGPFL